MENVEIFKSRENPNLRLLRYKASFYSLLELRIELNNRDLPKYPLVFSMSIRCEEDKADATMDRLMTFVNAEFPNNSWELMPS